MELKVVVRIRPLLSGNDQAAVKAQTKYTIAVDPKPRGNTLYSSLMRRPLDRKFTFDEILDESTSQEVTYGKIGVPMLNWLKQDRNSKACLFAFGQTGSGKSTSLLGHQLLGNGIIIRMAADIYAAYPSTSIKVSYVEVFNGRIIDLLSDERSFPRMLNDGVKDSLFDQSVVICNSLEEFQQIISNGISMRATAKTKMNAQSSRSHAVMICSFKIGSKEKTMCFIDLAGMETGSSAMKNNKARMEETMSINQSLFTLKRCILALNSRSGHVPFRETILTRFLGYIFTKGTLITMLACVHSSTKHKNSSMSTLEYADSFKSIPVELINIREDDTALLKEYRSMLRDLRETLWQQKEGKQKQRPYRVEVIQAYLSKTSKYEVYKALGLTWPDVPKPLSSETLGIDVKSYCLYGLMAQEHGELTLKDFLVDDHVEYVMIEKRCPIVAHAKKLLKQRGAEFLDFYHEELVKKLRIPHIEGEFKRISYPTEIARKLDM